MDRVKPERNPGAAKPPVGERRDEHPARKGFHHGTAVYGPVCTVVWEGRSREASPLPDFFPLPQESGILFVFDLWSTINEEYSRIKRDRMPEKMSQPLALARKIAEFLPPYADYRVNALI